MVYTWHCELILQIYNWVNIESMNILRSFFFMATSSFFHLPYILISCSPRNISMNISQCKSVTSYPDFALPLCILLHIFFLSLFLSSFSTFRKCWINFLLQFFCSLPHDFSISFQINLPCHLVSLEFSNYSVYKAWLLTDGASRIHTSTMYILGPEDCELAAVSLWLQFSNGCEHCRRTLTLFAIPCLLNSGV